MDALILLHLSLKFSEVILNLQLGIPLIINVWIILDLKNRKRQDEMIKDLDKKQTEHREKLAKLQQQFQKAQVQAMGKS